jgi:hypothetical protein
MPARRTIYSCSVFLLETVIAQDAFRTSPASATTSQAFSRGLEKAVREGRLQKVKGLGAALQTKALLARNCSSTARNSSKLRGWANSVLRSGTQEL